MADKTKIEWSDATWNVITGCAPVSPGCANCYAAQLAGTRLKNHPSRAGLTKCVNGRPVWTGEVRFNEEWLRQPLAWKKPRRIFVCAHGDLFHEAVKDEWLDQIFAVMAQASHHTFQILTKRPERMRAYMKAVYASRMKLVSRAAFDVTSSVLVARAVHLALQAGVIGNIWFGATAENQEQADKRIPLLLQMPAAKRFVSIEPMLGPVNLTAIEFNRDLTCNVLDGAGLSRSSPCQSIPNCRCKKLDWVICGGGSGSNARPMHPDWVRRLREDCKVAGVPFMFKQWGEWLPFSQRPDEIEVRHLLGYYIGEDAVFTQPPGNPPRRNGVCDEQTFRVGKKAAGRLLDGREYLEVPV